MKQIFFFLISFFYTSVVFSQDSSERKAVAKQNSIHEVKPENSGNSELNSSARNARSANSSEYEGHQTTENLKDSRRIITTEKENKEGPK